MVQENEVTKVPAVESAVRYFKPVNVVLEKKPAARVICQHDLVVVLVSVDHNGAFPVGVKIGLLIVLLCRVIKMVAIQRKKHDGKPGVPVTVPVFEIIKYGREQKSDFCSPAYLIQGNTGMVFGTGSVRPAFVVFAKWKSYY